MTSKIEWVEAVKSYVEMPVGYDPAKIAAEYVRHDGRLRLVGSDVVVLSTTKGECVGTIDEVVAWQSREQGAMERIEACGLTVDVSHIEWGAGDEDEAIVRAICSELDGMRVVTRPHIRGEDADAGLVHDIVDPRIGTVMVGWDGGVRTPCSLLDLQVE